MRYIHSQQKVQLSPPFSIYSSFCQHMLMWLVYFSRDTDNFVIQAKMHVDTFRIYGKNIFILHLVLVKNRIQFSNMFSTV